jgi:hypothetical protein
VVVTLGRDVEDPKRGWYEIRIPGGVVDGGSETLTQFMEKELEGKCYDELQKLDAREKAEFERLKAKFGES